jgi:gamma-glutamyltranspeptidase
MGSGLVPENLGFAFQDRGALFSLQDKSANVYAPGKRPFHTIIPGFVIDPRPNGWGMAAFGGQLNSFFSFWFIFLSGDGLWTEKLIFFFFFFDGF